MYQAYTATQEWNGRSTRAGSAVRVDSPWVDAVVTRRRTVLSAVLR
jgi:hypothetical protein